MKLSILIPVYNQDCSKLVADLIAQCNHTSIEYEVLVMDDGSTDEVCKQANRKIIDWANCSLFEFGHNQGRSRIRNQLVRRSKGEYLLMIDSDAVVAKPDFIQQYLDHLKPNTVICGGILHPDRLPSSQQSLRYMYEKTCEPKFTAAQRSKRPYQNLRTFNMLMPRAVAEAHPFNEQIRYYGYEDTLLGSELEQDHVQIQHLDNQLINGDIEQNSVFLDKTEESLRTLKQYEGDIRGFSALIHFYDKLHQHHLSPVIAFCYHLLRLPMRMLLLSRWPSFRVLQFYKLGYYCTL